MKKSRGLRVNGCVGYDAPPTRCCGGGAMSMRGNCIGAMFAIGGAIGVIGNIGVNGAIPGIVGVIPGGRFGVIPGGRFGTMPGNIGPLGGIAGPFGNGAGIGVKPGIGMNGIGCPGP